MKVKVPVYFLPGRGIMSIEQATEQYHAVKTPPLDILKKMADPQDLVSNSLGPSYHDGIELNSLITDLLNHVTIEKSVPILVNLVSRQRMMIQEFQTQLSWARQEFRREVQQLARLIVELEEERDKDKAP